MDPDTIIYNKKLGELKKYLPFLQDMESRLKSVPGDKNGVQLSKIQGLKNLIKGDKRMKMQNLIKCEQVLTKLYKKTTERIASSDCSVPVNETEKAVPAVDEVTTALKETTLTVKEVVKEDIPPVEKNITPVKETIADITGEEEEARPKLSLNFYKEQSNEDIEEKSTSKDDIISIESDSSVSVISELKTTEEIAVPNSSLNIPTNPPSSIVPVDVPVEAPILILSSPEASAHKTDKERSKIKINLSLNKSVRKEGNSSNTDAGIKSVQSTNNSTVTTENSASSEVKNNVIPNTNKPYVPPKLIPSGEQIKTILSTRMIKPLANNNVSKPSAESTSDLDMRTPFSDVDLRFNKVFMSKPSGSPNLIVCNDNLGKDTSLVLSESSLKSDTTRIKDTSAKFNSIPVILNRCNNSEVKTPDTSVPVVVETFSSENIVPGFVSDSDFRMIKTSYTDPTDIQNLTDFNIPSLNEVRTDDIFTTQTHIPNVDPAHIGCEFQVFDSVRSKLKSVISKDQINPMMPFNSAVDPVTVKSIVTKDITGSSYSTKAFLDEIEKKILGTEDKRKSPVNTPRKYTRVLMSPVRNYGPDYRSSERGSHRRYSRSPSPRRKRSKSRERSSKYSSDLHKKTRSPRSGHKYDDSSKERYKKKEKSPRRRRSPEKSDHRSSRRSRSKDRGSRKKYKEKEIPADKSREIELLGKKITEIIELNELRRKREKIVQELQEESFLNPEKSPESETKCGPNKGDREDGELGESDEEVDMLYSDLSEDHANKNKDGKMIRTSTKNIDDKKEKMAESLIKLNMILKDNSFKNTQENKSKKAEPSATTSVETMPAFNETNVLGGQLLKESPKSSREGLIKKMVDIITKEILPAKEKKQEVEVEKQAEKQIPISVVPSADSEDEQDFAEYSHIDDVSNPKKLLSGTSDTAVEPLSDATDVLEEPRQVEEEDIAKSSNSLKDDILKALASDTGTSVVSDILPNKKDEHVKEIASKPVPDINLSCLKARRISLETYKEKHTNSPKCDDLILKSRKNFQDMVKSVFTPKELARFDPILQPAMEQSPKLTSLSNTPVRPNTPVVHNTTVQATTLNSIGLQNANTRTSIPGLGESLIENKNDSLDKARQLFSQASQNTPVPPWATPVNRNFDVQVKKHVYASPFGFTPNSLLSPEPEDRRNKDLGFPRQQNSTELRGSGNFSNSSFNSGLPREMSHNQGLFSPRSGFETPDRLFNSNNSLGRPNFPSAPPRDPFASPRETSVPRTPQHDTNYAYYGQGSDSFAYRGGNEPNASKPYYEQNQRYNAQNVLLQETQRRSDPRDARCSNNFNRQYMNNREQDFNQVDNYGSRTPMYEANYEDDLMDNRSMTRNMPGNCTPVIDSWSTSEVWGRSTSQHRDYDPRRNFERERSVGRRGTPSRDYDGRNSWMGDRVSMTRDVDYARDTSVGRQSWQTNRDVNCDDRFRRDQSIGRSDDFQVSRKSLQPLDNFQRGRSVGRSQYEPNDTMASEHNFGYNELSRDNNSFEARNKFDRSRSVGRVLHDPKPNSRAKSVGPRSCLDKDSMFPAYKGNTTTRFDKRFEALFSNRPKPDFNRSRSLARESSVGRTYRQESRTENIYDDGKRGSSITKPMQKAIELIEKSKQTLHSRDPRLNKLSDKPDHTQVTKRDYGLHRDPRVNKSDSKSQPSEKSKSDSRIRSSKNEVDSKDRGRKSDSRTYRDTKRSEKEKDSNKNRDDSEHKAKGREADSKRDSRRTYEDGKHRSKDSRSSSSRDSKSRSAPSKSDSKNIKDHDKEKLSKDDVSKSRIRKNSNDSDKEKHSRDAEVPKSSIRIEHCNQREKISHFKIPKLKKVDSDDSCDNNSVEKVPSNADVSTNAEKSDSQISGDKKCSESVDGSNSMEIQNSESVNVTSAINTNKAKQQDKQVGSIEKVDNSKKKRKKKANKKKNDSLVPNSANMEKIGPYSISEIEDESSGVEPLFKYRTSGKSNKSRPLIFDDSSDDNDFGDEPLNSSIKSDKKQKSLSELNEMLFDKLIGVETVDDKSDACKSDSASVRETRNRRKSVSSLISTESNEEFIQKPQTSARKSVRAKRASNTEELRQSEISDLGESDSSLLEIVKMTKKKINKSKLTKCNKVDNKKIQKDASFNEDDCNKELVVEADNTAVSGTETVIGDDITNKVIDSNTDLDTSNKDKELGKGESESENSVIESPLKSRLRRSVRQTTKILESPKITKVKKSVAKTTKNLSDQMCVESDSNSEKVKVDSQQCDAKSSVDDKLDVGSTTSTDLDVSNSENENLPSSDVAEKAIPESELAVDSSKMTISTKTAEIHEDSCQSNVVDSSNVDEASKAESRECTVKSDNTGTEDPNTSNKKENQAEINSLVEILKNKEKMLQILAMLNDTGEGISEKVKKRLEKLTEIESDDEEDDKKTESKNESMTQDKDKVPAVDVTDTPRVDSVSDKVEIPQSSETNNTVQDAETTDPSASRDLVNPNVPQSSVETDKENSDLSGDGVKIREQNEVIPDDGTSIVESNKRGDNNNAVEDTVVKQKESIATAAGDGGESNVDNADKATDKSAVNESKSVNCKTPEDEMAKGDTDTAQNKGKKKYGKGIRELQMLHEYNFDMFISDDVLKATGVRSCTIAHLENTPTNAASKSLTTSPAAKESKAVETKQPKSKKSNILEVSKASKIKKAKNITGVTKKKKVVMKANRELMNNQPRVLVMKTNLGPVSYPKDVYEYSDDSSVVEDYQLIKQKPCPKSKKLTVNTNSNQSDSLVQLNQSNDGSPVRPSGKKLKSSKKAKKKRNSWQSGIIKKSKKKRLKIRNDVDYCDKSYNFNENVKEFKCKICYYSGNNIVKHYKLRHPHSEVMISRLNPEQAKLACEEVVSEKKSKLQHIKMYRCRFCMKLFRVRNLRMIFDHIVYSHTGEYKKECSMCSTKTVKKCVSVCNKSSTLPPADDFIDSVTGYMCGLCNYTQLSHENLKTHIWLRHFHEECELKEINLTLQNARRRMLKSGLEVAKTEDTKVRIKKKSRKPVDNILTTRLRTEMTTKKTINIQKGKVAQNKKDVVTIAKKPAADIEKSVDDDNSKKTQEPGVVSDDRHMDIETDTSQPALSANPVLTPQLSTASADIALRRSTASPKSASSTPQLPNEGRSMDSGRPSSTQQSDVSTDSNVFHVTANLNVIPDINIKQEIHEEQFLEEDTAPDVNVKLEHSPSQDASGVQTSKSIIKIGSIQMKQTSSKPEYYCFINDCTFNSNYLLIFMSHIVSHDSDWNGYCDECNRKILPTLGESSNFKYNKALEHLLSVHSNNTASDRRESPVKIKREVVEEPIEKQDNLLTEKNKTVTSQKSQEPVASQSLLLSRNSTESPVPVSPAPPSRVTTPKINVRSIKDLMSASPNITTTNNADNSGVCQLRIESVVSLNPNVDKPSSTTPEPVIVSSNTLNVQTTNTEQISDKESSVSPTKEKVFISKLNVKTGTTANKTIMPYIPTSHELFKCLKCIFASNDMREFVKHFTGHTASVYRCIYCIFQTPDAQKLGEHILDEHGASRFRCLLCDYRASVPLLVSTHALAFHKVRMMTVGEVSAHASVKEGGLIKGLLPKRRCVLPYVCPVCLPVNNASGEIHFYSADAFENHLTSHGSVPLKCVICKNAYPKSFSIKNLILHMKAKHNYKLLVCPYCTVTCETKAEALGHLMVHHSGRRPLLYLRLNTGTKGSTNGDKVVLLNLDKGEYYRNTLNFTGIPKDHAIKTNPCQLTKSELDMIVAAENDKGQIAMTTLSGSVLESGLSNKLAPSKTSTVTSESNVESSMDTSSNAAPNPVSCSTPTKDIDAVQATTLPDREADDVIVVESDDESSHRGSITNTNRKSQDDTFSITSTDIDEEAPEKTTSEKVTQKHSTQLEKAFSAYSSEALNILMKWTGIPNEQLFRCGNATCKYSTLTSNDLKDHLVICEHAKEFDMLSCYHCSKEFRNAYRLLDHIRTHGIHRYQCNECYLCFYGNASATQHMRKSHKIMNTITIPLRPFKSDADVDYFVVKSATDKSSVIQKRKPGPKSKVQCTVPQSPPPLAIIPSSVPVKKNTFGPDEISQLPLNPILTEEIYCKVCNFATKVRSNLLRHLQMHANEIAVPSVAPINPVPHLESNEMHFDKMTNLALSSNMNKPAAPKKKEVNNKVDDKNYPKFVPDKERFVCGSIGCKYISVDEMMLRFHWETLHFEESVYHCVHCGEDVVEGNRYLSTGNIAAHLRLHEETLYGCDKCTFIHPLQRNVEKHCIEAHGKDFSVCLRTLKQPTANETQPESDSEPKVWQCTMCQTKTKNKLMILAHCKSIHKVKYQYKCSKCSYSQPAKALFGDHFLKKHLLTTPDIVCVYNRIDDREEPTSVDNSPLWWKQRKRASIFSEEGASASQVTDNQTTDHPSPAKIPKTVSSNPPAVETPTLTSNFDINKGVLPSYTSVKTEGNNYKCPFCVKFMSESRTDMQTHLFEELNYRCWSCLTCSYKSFSSDKILEHARQNHGTGLTKYLKGNPGVERWVNGLLSMQNKAIAAYQQSLDRQSNALEETDLVIDETAQEMTKNKKLSLEKNPAAVKCPHCDFVSVNGMKMHIKRHWKIKPLGCGYCDSGFIRKIELKSHIGSAHPGREYLCKVNEMPSTPEIIPLQRGKRMLPPEEITPSTEEVSALKVFKPMYTNKTHMCIKCEHHLNEDEFTNHKITCNGGRKYPIVKKKTIVLKCSICMQLTIDIEGLYEHFGEEHPGMEINYVMHSVGKPKTKRILKPNVTETITSNIDNFSHYTCVYCNEKFNNYATCISHHNVAHNGKLIRIVPMSLCQLNESEEVRTVLITNSECCIVGCLYKAPNITCLLSHIRSHYITYKCHFCNTGFSLYKFYKDHTLSHAGMVCKDREEFTGNTVAQDRLIKIFNMFKSKNLFSVHANERSYIFEDDMQFVPPATTKTKQVARKSTTYLGQYTCDDSSMDSTKFVDEYSYYGVRPDPIDLKKITISVAFFGTQKTIAVEQLKAIENLFPKVLIDDLKNKE